MAARYFLIQARANRLMNHRLYEAVKQLSQEELVAPRSGRFASLHEALKRLLDVSVFYDCALHDQRFDMETWSPHAANAVELAQSQKVVDEGVIEFCRRLADDDLGETFVDEIGVVKDEVRERVDLTLLDLFTSQSHLRGGILTMLSGSSVTPPDLDIFLMAGEWKARAGDLAACRLTEADLKP